MFIIASCLCWRFDEGLSSSSSLNHDEILVLENNDDAYLLDLKEKEVNNQGEC